MQVKFYDTVADELLKFAVIVARCEDKWVFCKHRERDTYECPGGHREPGETIEAAARRELYEETGAVDYRIEPVCVYSVLRDTDDADESYGMLYYAEVFRFEEELHSEIEKIVLSESLTENWTYPLIQPRLFEAVREKGYVLWKKD